MATDNSRATRPLLAVLPVAGGIAVFGVVYGALAGPRLGHATAVASSLLIFSGTVQFSVVGLLAAGAAPAAILVTAATLNARNLVLGALIRPHLRASAAGRAGLAWFLLDETVGLSIADRGRAGRTLLLTGLVCGLAWVSGTAAGVAGGAATNLEPVAEAVFPVLFVALAAIATTGRRAALRVGVAAAATAGLALLAPTLAGLAPVVASVAVAAAGGDDATKAGQ